MLTGKANTNCRRATGPEIHKRSQPSSTQLKHSSRKTSHKLSRAELKKLSQAQEASRANHQDNSLELKKLIKKYGIEPRFLASKNKPKFTDYAYKLALQEVDPHHKIFRHLINAYNEEGRFSKKQKKELLTLVQNGFIKPLKSSAVLKKLTKELIKLDSRLFKFLIEPTLTKPDNFEELSIEVTRLVRAFVNSKAVKADIESVKHLINSGHLKFSVELLKIPTLHRAKKARKSQLSEYRRKANDYHHIEVPKKAPANKESKGTPVVREYGEVQTIRVRKKMGPPRSVRLAKALDHEVNFRGPYKMNPRL